MERKYPGPNFVRSEKEVHEKIPQDDPELVDEIRRRASDFAPDAESLRRNCRQHSEGFTRTGPKSGQRRGTPDHRTPQVAFGVPAGNAVSLPHIPGGGSITTEPDRVPVTQQAASGAD